MSLIPDNINKLVDTIQSSAYAKRYVFDIPGLKCKLKN